MKKNDPEQEIRKFDWLLEEDMITQEEYKEIVSQIAFDREIKDTVFINLHHHHSTSSSSPDRIKRDLIDIFLRPKINLRLA